MRRVGDDSVCSVKGLLAAKPEPPLFLYASISLLVSGSFEVEESCLAVMEIYLDAREPAVILSERDMLVDLFDGVLNGRCIEMELGVTLPLENEGVTRPPEEGVILPFENEADGVRDAENTEGVVLPEVDTVAGVILPPLEDATDEGR